MFNIRDWTLREQHNLTVAGLSSMAGFITSLFVLNSLGIADLNARMAVTVSAMLFFVAFGLREFHFQSDPLVSQKVSVDLAVLALGLLTVASLVYAGYDHFSPFMIVLPVILLLILPFYLVRSRHRSPLANPRLTRQDLTAITAAYLRMDLPSYRPRVKEAYTQAAEIAGKYAYETERLNELSGEARLQAVRRHCQRAKIQALRSVLMETIGRDDLEPNDRRLFVRAGTDVNRAALDEALIDRENFDAWQKTLNAIESTLPKSLQDIAK